MADSLGGHPHLGSKPLPTLFFLQQLAVDPFPCAHQNILHRSLTLFVHLPTQKVYDLAMEIRNILEIAEVRAAISSALGVSQQVMTNWKQRGIPEERCPDVERATNGKYTVEEMQPAVKWCRIKDKSWPHPKGRPLMDVASKEAA